MRWVRRVGGCGAFVLAGAVAFGPGCRAVLKTDRYHVARADPDSGNVPLNFQNAACGQCMTSGCVGEIADCERDPACRKWTDCVARCDPKDGRCVYACDQLVSQKSTPLNRLLACQEGSCASQCWSCGFLFSGITPDCAQCALDDFTSGGLCEKTNTCLADLACSEYARCLTTEMKRVGYPNPGERLHCGQMYPDAARQFYLTVGLQFFLGCFAQCSAGQDWICPLPTEWPPRTGSRATLRLHVPPATSVPDASAPSVHVRACSGGEYTCGAAVVEADSDADGVATLHVDQNTSENAYYFELYDALATAPFLIYSPRQPVVGDTDLWIPSSAPSTSLDPAIAVRGEQRMPATGWVWVNIADCVGGNADFLSGAPRVTMSGQGQPYYVDRNGVWDATATGGGTAAFVNVPEGSFSVRVFLDGDTTHAIASAVVPIRAGVETMVSFNYPQFY